MTRKAFSLWLAVCLTVVLVCTVSFTGSADSGLLDEAFTKQSYSVKTAGAKGDGKTDDTEAIKQAVANVTKDGQGSVFFPAGTYLVNGKLTIANAAELVFAKGAILKIGASATFKMFGTIVAGDYQVFDVQGKWSGFNGVSVGNPIWFGAKGDGKTDDTAALQKTFDIFYQVNVPYTAAGYKVKDLAIPHSCRITGANREKQVKLIAAAGTQKLLTFKSSYMEFYSFDLEMAAAPTATAIYLQDDGVIEQNRFADVTINDAYRAVEDKTNTGSNMVITTEFINFKCYRGKNSAFVCHGMWGFMFFKNILVDFSASTVKMDFPAIAIENNAGMIMDHVTVLGNSNATANAHGIYTKKSEAMWWSHCTVENMGGMGFKHERGGGANNWFYFLDCTVKNCKDYSIGLFNSFSESIHNCKLEGGKGVYASGNVCQISNTVISGSSGNGITNEAKESVFTDLTLNNNKGYGIVSTANNCQLYHIQGTGNTNDLVKVSGNGSQYVES
ncbi:MAG: hypothetical protein IKI50_07120 [Clostridia bacterium]|nr:hypothetical protein [Clostridia bacterium]